MIAKTNQRKRQTKSRKSKNQRKRQTKSRKSKKQSKSRQRGGKCQSTYGFVPGVDIGGTDGVHIKSVMAPINISKSK